MTRTLRAVRRTAGAVARRLGRRGASLGWFGVLDLSFALSMFDPGQQAQLRQTPSYRIILLIDLRIWAVLWLAVGLLCLLQAWMTDDRLAFTAQITLLWIWAMFTILAVGPQAPRAIIGAIIWTTFGGFVLILSGWPEAPRNGAPPTARQGGDE